MSPIVPGTYDLSVVRFYQPKAAIADLMAMPPMRVRRISRPMAARKTCGICSAGGTRDHRVRVSLPAVPSSADDLALGDALRPAKADFVEIEVGMLGADVMKDTGHRALYPQIKALDRVGVNPPANIFAAPMLNGLVRGEVLADSDKRLPFVAHQVGRGFDLFLEHAFDFIRREIGDHCGPGIAGRGAPRGRVGPLHHRQDWLLRGPPQTFATAAWRRLVDPLLRPSAEKELVDLDRAAERVLARQHQAQGMSNAPGGRLAHPKCLGQTN